LFLTSSTATVKSQKKSFSPVLRWVVSLLGDSKHIMFMVGQGKAYMIEMLECSPLGRELGGPHLLAATVQNPHLLRSPAQRECQGSLLSTAADAEELVHGEECNTDSLMQFARETVLRGVTTEGVFKYDCGRAETCPAWEWAT
jgi:hypothetical protein